VTRHSATLVADRRIEGVELAGDPDRRPIVLLLDSGHNVETVCISAFVYLGRYSPTGTEIW